MRKENSAMILYDSTVTSERNEFYAQTRKELAAAKRLLAISRELNELSKDVPAVGQLIEPIAAVADELMEGENLLMMELPEQPETD
jgi:hypothetical protein